MEYVDVLTADGQATGQRVLRGVAHSQGIWHRTVHVWVRNRSGELLFQRRSLDKETFPDFWDISAAGHLSAGDVIRDAAVREMYEELGVSIEPEALRFLFDMRGSYKSSDGLIQDNEFSGVYLCMAPVEADELVLDPKEVSAAMYYSIPEVKRLLNEKSGQFVPHDDEYERLFEALDELKQ
jgi:isopentenyl-diphosphate Delta-isomerase